MQSSSVIAVSPSFTAHSSKNLADIAARVVQEFRNENGHEDDDDIYSFNDEGDQAYVPADGTRTENLKENEADSDDGGEFEFAVVCTESDSSTVSADEIFSNGEILPRYPLFDRSLLLNDVPNLNKAVADNSEANSKPSPVVRLPLRKLFSEERDSASCSSSETDDFDGVTPGTYCIWKPKVESPGRCKKSNSTGNTSKRWKFRDLLHRSNSDSNLAAGNKDASILLFRPLTKTKRADKVKKVEKTAKVAGAGDEDGESAPLTDENNPVNKMNKGGNRLRSYLPYKHDLVGIFPNINGLGRNLSPF